MTPHVEFLLEEPSAEAFLRPLLARAVAEKLSYSRHVHQGKRDLLGKLDKRLRGYAKWLPETSRIIVLVGAIGGASRVENAHHPWRLHLPARQPYRLRRTGGLVLRRPRSDPSSLSKSFSKRLR